MIRANGALIAFLVAACIPPVAPDLPAPDPDRPYAFVLGIAQDGGYPHAGCNQPHCERASRDPRLKRNVTALAIVDPASQSRWVIEATPDFPEQLRMLDRVASPRHPEQRGPRLEGILLTHAHIGHYSGLMHLGREVMGAAGVPVYAMPRMAEFLSKNGPWDQLVRLQNIRLVAMRADEPIQLNKRIRITPFLVPHRDEYSETVGFRIEGPSASVVFIPDIDKWERWSTSIEEVVREADAALLDGTFFADGEVSGRSMSEIPHPFIIESLERFRSLLPHDRQKIRFIHLNHTNPALQLDSEARRTIERAGFRLAEQFERIPL